MRVAENSVDSPVGYRKRRLSEISSLYIPIDRRYALADGQSLPDRTTGAGLFADLSGFMALSEITTERLGRQRGAEELTRQLNRVYQAMVAQVHRYRGSVIGFVGDAITCWFDGDDGRRATACALGMQRAMDPDARGDLEIGETAAPSIKIGIAAGPARRFLVGDPRIQVIDVLVGKTIERIALAEGMARKGEVLLDASVVASLQDDLSLREWRRHAATGDRFAVVRQGDVSVQLSPWPALPPGALAEVQTSPWVLLPLRERLGRGYERFQADLRPVAALFLKFSGIDYDGDGEASEKLDRYTRWVQGVVDRYEGSLIQLTIGDKGSFFYVAFGAPVAHNNDTARAVKAALTLQTPPAEFNFVTSAQIGVAQGLARTGAYGSRTRRTYGVIGKDVVLSARLMEAAPPGEIWCSYDVYRRTRDQIDFESLPSIHVKGKEELVRIYRPMGGRFPDVQRDAGERIIGRQEEVAHLADCLDAIEAGESRILMIEGEAGIGKSRLVTELAHMAKRRGLAGLVGAGQTIEQQTPYRAWRDVFSTYFDIDGVVDPDERRRQVRAAVRQLAPDQLARLPLLNDLFALDLPDNDLTASLTPELRHQSLVLLLVALLRVWAESQPLILVLEDAHWLDTLSWELALSTARTLTFSGCPFLMVVVTRPMEGQRAGARHLQSLGAMEGAEIFRLSPLSSEETVALAAARLGLPASGLPEAIADLVRQRAEGNPFFAEELVFALRDQGAITVDASQSPARCITHGDLAQIGQSLPDTIQGLVLARVDRLPPEQQLTLKVASVIGRTFAFDLLRYALKRHVPIATETIKDHLDQMDALGLTPLETVEPLTYIFRHVITRDVAYQTLLFTQRRQLHRTVAEWYEAQARERVSRRLEGESASPRHLDAHLPLLVRHYRQAEDVERERHYARLAGEQAAARFANNEAVSYLSRALALTPETAYADRYSLLSAREKVLHLLGTREAQFQDLEALRKLAEKLDDDQQRYRIVLRRANYYMALSDYRTAEACFKAVLAPTRGAVARSIEVKARIGLGSLTWHRGAFDEAVPWLEGALSLARELGSQEDVVTALYELSGVEWLRGDEEKARDYATQSLALGREVADWRGIAEALNRLGIVAITERNYKEARKRYMDLLTIAQDIGDQRNIVFGFNNLGYLAYLNERYREAVRLFEKAMMVSKRIGFRYMVATCLANLGTTCAAMVEVERAREYLLDGLCESIDVGSVHTTLHCLVSIAWLRAHAGEYERAAELLGLALGHPALEGDVRQDTAEPIHYILRAVLPSSELEMALERGKKLDLEQAVAEILERALLSQCLSSEHIGVVA